MDPGDKAAGRARPGPVGACTASRDGRRKDSGAAGPCGSGCAFWITSWGRIRVTAVPAGLSEIRLPPAVYPPPFKLRWRERAPRTSPLRPLLDRALTLVEAILNGGDAPRPPISLVTATAFQRSVWQALSGLPRGHVVTYGGLARRIGRPRAARAVGRACGANPLPLALPCHRVVGARGLGGFGSGVAWKQLLLEREGVRLAP
jgi:O-6-methylguanine DNA methyltransferase